MGVPALFSTDSLLTPEEGATAGLASSRQISLNNPHKQKTRYDLRIGVFIHPHNYYLQLLVFYLNSFIIPTVHTDKHWRIISFTLFKESK